MDLSEVLFDQINSCIGPLAGELNYSHWRLHQWGCSESHVSSRVLFLKTHLWVQPRNFKVLFLLEESHFGFKCFSWMFNLVIVSAILWCVVHYCSVKSFFLVWGASNPNLGQRGSTAQSYMSSYILKLSVKSGDKGLRTASFSIIGHRMCNWEKKIYKTK
jgi:hypothetical protein